MTQTSKFRKHSEVIKISSDYVTKRIKGEIKGYKTGYSKIDEIVAGDGLEGNVIITIAGLSSTGKSTFGARLLYNLVNLNPNCLGLFFNYEMVSRKIIEREIAFTSGITLKELYNTNNPQSTTVETKEEKEIQKRKIERLLNNLKTYYDSIKDYNILYVEEPSYGRNIADTLFNLWTTDCKEKNTTLVYLIDHAGIVDGETAKELERMKLINLMNHLNNLKKRIAEAGGTSIGIVLSQMNRNIESDERRMNPSLHFPQQSDLAESSSLAHYSDIIIFAHNPSKLKLFNYGIAKFPTKVNFNKVTYPIIYLHIVKNRDGALGDLACIGNLAYFDIKIIDDFKQIVAKAPKGVECIDIPEKEKEKVLILKNDTGNNSKTSATSSSSTKGN